jgi:hypothetical protein
LINTIQFQFLILPYMAVVVGLTRGGGGGGVMVVVWRWWCA